VKVGDILTELILKLALNSSKSGELHFVAVDLCRELRLQDELQLVMKIRSKSAPNSNLA
jgi:hypothetical protein